MGTLTKAAGVARGDAELAQERVSRRPLAGETLAGPNASEASTAPRPVACWCAWSVLDDMTHDEYVERNALPPHVAFSAWEDALHKYGEDSRFADLFPRRGSELECWCTFDASWYPLSHDEFVSANDYPPHEVSPEWNLPEPVYTYDQVTDLFYRDGHPVPPPDFSPGTGDSWESWRLAHELPDDFWETASVREDGPSLWRRYHAEPGYVNWDGVSDDAASSEADDLDYAEPCWFCGWSPYEGMDHAAWYPENSHAEPHEYEPGPQPEGGLVISYANWYDIDGYPTHPDSRPDEVDEPVWTLLRLMYRTQFDEEGFLDELVSGLTVAEARERATHYDGYLLGD